MGSVDRGRGKSAGKVPVKEKGKGKGAGHMNHGFRSIRGPERRRGWSPGVPEDQEPRNVLVSGRRRDRRPWPVSVAVSGPCCLLSLPPTLSLPLTLALPPGSPDGPWRYWVSAGPCDDASHGAVGILPAVRPSLRKLVVHARAGSPRHHGSIATVTGADYGLEGAAEPAAVVAAVPDAESLTPWNRHPAG
jgi:hypothetical protein